MTVVQINYYSFWSKKNHFISSILLLYLLKLQVFTKPLGRIDITPQAFIPGAKIVRYIGSYNFFFIRETTSNREVCITGTIWDLITILKENGNILSGEITIRIILLFYLGSRDFPFRVYPFYTLPHNSGIMVSCWLSMCPSMYHTSVCIFISR